MYLYIVVGIFIAAVGGVVSFVVEDYIKSKQKPALQEDSSIKNTAENKVVQIAPIVVIGGIEDRIKEAPASNPINENYTDNNKPLEAAKTLPPKIISKTLPNLHLLQLPIHEDFSKHEEGDHTDWGGDVYIKTGRDGRRWLVTSIEGTHSIGQDVQFPDNYIILFSFNAVLDRSKAIFNHENIQTHKGGKIFSNIRLVESAGRNYKIQWMIDCRWQKNFIDHYFSNDDQDIKYYHTLTMPDGGKNVISDDKSFGTLRIDKRENTIKVLINGQLAISGNVSGYGQFVRFELDVSKAENESLSFTDFRIDRM